MTKEEILNKYDNRAENLLQILHDFQQNNSQNYLTKDDLKIIANYLSLPESFVQGVVTFYSMFSLTPRGKYVIRICESPPCHLMGSSTIIKEVSNYLGIDLNETTKDGLFTLELSSCLGVCGVAPAMTINEEVFGNLDSQKIKEIIEEKRRGK
jgi:NADH-quinone oxidoreductase subunit E